MQDKSIQSKKENKTPRQKPKIINKNWPLEIIKLSGEWKDFPSLTEIRKFDIPASKSKKTNL